MSAYSTLNITRGKAVQTLLAKIEAGLTDEELAAFMNRELETRLYNVRIVADDEPNDDEVV